MHSENEGPILDLHRFNVNYGVSAVLVCTKPMTKTYFSKLSVFARKACKVPNTLPRHDIDDEEMSYLPEHERGPWIQKTPLEGNLLTTKKGSSQAQR